MKKLLFLIIIIALGFGYWFMSQKSTLSPSGVGTSDWQTFRSEKYGYEVKYPTGAEFKNINSDASTSVKLEKFLNVPENLISEKNNSVAGLFSLSNSFFVEPATNSQNLPLREWLYTNIFNGYRGPDPGQNAKEIALAGIPAYYTEQNYDGKSGLYAYKRYTIYVLHNGNLYQISGVKLPQSPTAEWLAHPYYQYLEKSIPISEAILNSFRFTN